MSNNPLLAKVQIPGQVVRLPSGGLHYGDGELSPDVQNGELHVRPMTAIDEITIRSPDMIVSGQALRDVFKNCIPGILKPERLLMRDVDYLLMALRQTTYGDTYEMGFKHDCEHAKMHTYTISLPALINKTIEYDSEHYEQLRTVTMPNGQIVTLRPAMVMEDLLKIIQMTDFQAKQTDIRTLQDQRIMGVGAMIARVSDVTDPSMIAEWLAAIPLQWFTTISDAIDKLSGWGPDTKSTFVCKDCGSPFEVDIPLNPVVFFS